MRGSQRNPNLKRAATGGSLQIVEEAPALRELHGSLSYMGWERNVIPAVGSGRAAARARARA